MTDKLSAIIGFKHDMWPLEAYVNDILHAFARCNNMTVSALNAAIWLDKHNDGEASCKNAYVNVSFFNVKSISRINDFAYPYAYTPTSYDVCEDWYAKSFADYLKLCADSRSMFKNIRTTSTQPIAGADCALVEYDLKSSFKE